MQSYPKNEINTTAHTIGRPSKRAYHSQSCNENSRSLGWRISFQQTTIQNTPTPMTTTSASNRNGLHENRHTTPRSDLIPDACRSEPLTAFETGDPLRVDASNLARYELSDHLAEQ